MPPIAFTGFARNSRNVLWFVNDSIGGFQLAEDYMAKPQVVARVMGEDDEVQAFYLEENIALFKATLTAAEQKKKSGELKNRPLKPAN